jgi:stage V sporulation protein AE
MIFFNAFLVGGLLCLVAQLLMDIFHLLPIHLTVLYVLLGSVFEAFGLYDKLIAFGGAGALLPISSFGHSLSHAALSATKEKGLLGLFTGIFDITASGISFAVFFSFLAALVFKPKG